MTEEYHELVFFCLIDNKANDTMCDILRINHLIEYSRTCGFPNVYDSLTMIESICMNDFRPFMQKTGNSKKKG